MAFGLVGLVAFLFVGEFIPIGNAQAVNSVGNNIVSAGSGTCTLNGVAQYDLVVVAIMIGNTATTTSTISTVADGSGNTYTSQVAANLNAAATNVSTRAALYTAPINTLAGGRGTITVTVTLSATAKLAIICYDTVGFGGTAAHTSTGTGTYTTGTSNTPSVGSYTPTATNFEVSAVATASCNTPPTVAGPATVTTTTGTTTASEQCSVTGAPSFYDFGTASYVLSSAGAPTTDGYTITSPSTVNYKHAFTTWTEVAMDLPRNTVKSQSLTETVALAVNASQRAFCGATHVCSESISLTAMRELANRLNTEPVALFTKFALAQPVNVEGPMCLGIDITVQGVDKFNSGPLCQVTSVVGVVFTQTCNFFQLQCWAYPLLFMGLYMSFFIGAAIAFNFSEKGFLYFVLAGATYASLIEISLGIMTPFIPVALIALNVAYSFRLDRLLTGGGSNSQ